MKITKQGQYDKRSMTNTQKKSLKKAEQKRFDLRIQGIKSTIKWSKEFKRFDVVPV